MKKENITRVLDFAEYKKSGKLSYVEIDDHHIEEETPDNDKTLAKLAEVMSLSTDELFLEIGFILERGASPRELELDLLLPELSGRLALMESICLYASNLTKS